MPGLTSWMCSRRHVRRRAITTLGTSENPRLRFSASTRSSTQSTVKNPTASSTSSSPSTVTAGSSPSPLGSRIAEHPLHRRGRGRDVRHSNKLLGKTILRGARPAHADWFARVVHRFPTGDCATGFQPVETFQPGRYIIKSVSKFASVGFGDDAVIEVTSLDVLHPKSAAEPPPSADRPSPSRISMAASLTSPCSPAAPASRRRSSRTRRFSSMATRESSAHRRLSRRDGTKRPTNTTTPRGASIFPRTTGTARTVDRTLPKMLACRRLKRIRQSRFRVDESIRPFILEINTNPCLSPDAGFAAALEKPASPPAEAVRRILTDC